MTNALLSETELRLNSKNEIWFDFRLIINDGLLILVIKW